MIGNSRSTEVLGIKLSRISVGTRTGLGKMRGRMRMVMMSGRMRMRIWVGDFVVVVVWVRDVVGEAIGRRNGAESRRGEILEGLLGLGLGRRRGLRSRRRRGLLQG